MVNYKSLLFNAGLAVSLVFSPLNPAVAHQNKTLEPAKVQYEHKFSDFTFCTREHIIDYVKKEAHETAESYLRESVEEVLPGFDQEILDHTIDKQIAKYDSVIKQYMESEYSDTPVGNALERNRKLKKKVNKIDDHISQLQPGDMQLNSYLSHENPEEELEEKMNKYKALLEGKKERYVERATRNNSVVRDYFDNINDLGKSVGFLVTLEILEKNNPEFLEGYSTEK